MFTVTLSALPDVATRVFRSLAYSTLTFEGGASSSSESGIETVRIFIPFRLFDLVPTPCTDPPCRLAMEKGERKMLIVRETHPQDEVSKL